MMTLKKKTSLRRCVRKKGRKIHFPITYACIILKRFKTRLVLLEQTSFYFLTSLLESLEHISFTKPSSIDFFPTFSVSPFALTWRIVNRVRWETSLELCLLGVCKCHVPLQLL